MDRPIPRLVIAGTHSGVGKTTIAAGLMAAFHLRGLSVQGFKVGPDYIDPTFLTLATGRPARNLDSWMAGRHMPGLFQRAAEWADLAIIEGVMGLYDGRGPLDDTASTADVARRLKAPVILVVDGGGAARSVAATVLGFQTLDPRVALRGVIVNRVSSDRHGQLIQSAVESVTGLPVWGWLLASEPVRRPRRHLGLIPAGETQDAPTWVAGLAAVLSRALDLDRLWQLAQSAPAVFTAAGAGFPGDPEPARMRLAVARDAAFNFYYPENLELLVHMGAEIAEFSPLAGEPLPVGSDALYLGGGFPEEFLPDLGDARYLAAIRYPLQQGLPVLAECGGYLYLARSITTDRHTMPGVGMVPAAAVLTDRLAGLGYREITAAAPSWLLPAGERIRGHEFHYADMRFPGDGPTAPAWQWTRSGRAIRDGHLTPTLAAGFPHLYLLSAPWVAKRLIAAGQRYRRLLR
ncbi:MAG: cobyrinate a,c-diamide synthase [Thermaerobacter sp.]|nr:cobyrinate a,c-diamide synthase [Thermaerobacter sp.]